MREGSKTGSLYKVLRWPEVWSSRSGGDLNWALSSAGAKDAESGGKGRQIRRPFHPDYSIPGMT